jgi:hypothetical protein
MLVGFSDGSRFSDGGSFISRLRRLLTFNSISLPPAKVRRHPHALSYTFGSQLFASIVPYHG